MNILKAIKKFFKKNWKSILKFLAVIGGIILIVVGAKKISQIGKVKYKKKWKPITGSDTHIMIHNDTGTSEVVPLPINPETGKPVKLKEIVQVGLPEKYDTEEVINFELKTTGLVNRRDIANSD